MACSCITFDGIMQKAVNLLKKKNQRIKNLKLKIERIADLKHFWEEEINKWKEKYTELQKINKFNKNHITEVRMKNFELVKENYKLQEQLKKKEERPEGLCDRFIEKERGE